MKEVILKDPQGVNIQGISINCTSLLSAYNHMHDYHPGFDFRFVPDIKEVISLIETNRYTQNTRAVINSSKKPFDLIQEKLDQLEKPLTFFYWDHLANCCSNLSINYSKQNEDIWSGVPIYFIDTNRFGESRTWMFLNYSKAKKFAGKYKKYIETVNKSDPFVTLSIAKSPSIRVASLENFFEDYITAPKGSDLHMKNFDGFIGTTKYGSEKTVQYNIPYHKKWQELVSRKFRIISSFCSTITI